MSEAEVHSLEPKPKTTSSVLDALRERRASYVREATLDLDVPGYSGRLALRCGPIAGSVLTRLRERMERSRSPERDYNLNADTLIAATRDVVGRLAEADEYQPLDPDEPMRLDHVLAETLDFPPGANAREVVRGLFGLAPSPDVAVGVAAGRYMEWAAAINEQADEDYLGESPEARKSRPPRRSR